MSAFSSERQWDEPSRSDRASEGRPANLRARLAKSEVALRKAELLAAVERQLSARFSERHWAWREITAKANAAVKAADERIAALCEQVGVTEEFRPSVDVGWNTRGENGDKERRVELRKVAQTPIEAAGRQAKVSIEARAPVVHTLLIASALESAPAKNLLASIPTPEALMPPFDVRVNPMRDPEHGYDDAR